MSFGEVLLGSALLGVCFTLYHISRWILKGAVTLFLTTVDFVYWVYSNIPRTFVESALYATKKTIVFASILPLFPFWLVAQILQTDEVKKSGDYFHLAFLGLGATAVITGLLFAIYYFGVGLVMLVDKI